MRTGEALAALLTNRAATGRVERNCALAHQLAHLELDTVCGDDAVDEEQANRLAALRLMPVRKLAAAVAEGGSVSDIARRLDVTERMLLLREQHLHPAERAFVSKTVSAA